MFDFLKILIVNLIKKNKINNSLYYNYVYSKNIKYIKNRITVIEWSDNTKTWRKNDELHNEDGPAFIDYDGSKYWSIHGKLHRINGPAIETKDGSKFWYINGKRHREDGPAIINANGNKEWWKNGKLHREDGPAQEFYDMKIWYLNGQLHRIDGPAIERKYPNPNEYYIYGNKYTKNQFYWIFDNKIDLNSKEGQLAVKLKW